MAGHWYGLQRKQGEVLTCRGNNPVGPAVVAQRLKLPHHKLYQRGLPTRPVQQSLHLPHTNAWSSLHQLLLLGIIDWCIIQTTDASCNWAEETAFQNA